MIGKVTLPLYGKDYSIGGKNPKSACKKRLLVFRRNPSHPCVLSVTLFYSLCK